MDKSNVIEFPKNKDVEIEQLQEICNRLAEENQKIGTQYQKLLKEKSDLDRKIGFLEGQIEAYQYCMNCRR